MLPPGPRGAIWQTLQYMFDPTGWLTRVGKRYGELFTVPTVVRPLVLATRPEDVKAIFAADPDTYAPFAGSTGDDLLGRGSLLLQAGARHKRSRKLMTPPFHGARMRAYGSRIAEIAEAHLLRAPRGRFDVEELFRGISLEVILATVFGVEDDERAATGDLVLRMVRSFTPIIASFSFLRSGWFPPWRRFRRLMDEVHALLRVQIAERRDDPGTDICGLLVAARDEDGQPMDEQEMVDQLVTLLIAGHETTATALAWAVDEVWRQPALLARAREELPRDPDALVAHPLLDAVCAETLRLHPIVPIVGRALERDFELGGYTIPKGHGVGACLTLVHQREELYPDPREFRPERFLDGRSFSPHEFFPWGGGARRCLGASFALFEMKIVFGMLVHGSEVKLARSERARTGVRPATIGPRGGVPVELSPILP